LKILTIYGEEVMQEDSFEFIEIKKMDTLDLAEDFFRAGLATIQNNFYLDQAKTFLNDAMYFAKNNGLNGCRYLLNQCLQQIQFLVNERRFSERESMISIYKELFLNVLNVVKTKFPNLNQGALACFNQALVQLFETINFNNTTANLVMNLIYFNGRGTADENLIGSIKLINKIENPQLNESAQELFAALVTLRFTHLLEEEEKVGSSVLKDKLIQTIYAGEEAPADINPFDLARGFGEAAKEANQKRNHRNSIRRNTDFFGRSFASERSGYNDDDRSVLQSITQSKEAIFTPLEQKIGVDDWVVIVEGNRSSQEISLGDDSDTPESDGCQIM
jgi:hypothetical protein